MNELTNDLIYEILSERYDELLLDYILLSDDGEYLGAESHKKAVIEAIAVLNTRMRVGNNLRHPQFYTEEEKMCCKEYAAEDFFSDQESRIKVRITPEHMTYWRAFYDPPYGVPYSKEDFRRINHILFPVQYRNDLEIFSWNDDFSNYFDDGKEWWGTAMWSVYDPWMHRFVIIGASLTD